MLQDFNRNKRSFGFPAFRFLPAFSLQPLAFSLISNVTVTYKMTEIVVVTSHPARACAKMVVV